MKEIYDNLNNQIKEKLLRSTGRLNPYSYKKFPELINEINKVTSFLNEDSTLSARVYCIKNYIYEKPICKVCGKDIEFKKYYAETCCITCNNTYISRNSAEKRSKTLKENSPKKLYNIILSRFNKMNKDNQYELLKIDTDIDIIIFKCLICGNINKRSFNSFRENTYCTNTVCRNRGREETVEKIYGEGIKNVFQSSQFKKKYKKYLKTIGAEDNISQSKKWKDLWKNKSFVDDIESKKYITYRKNNSFITSKFENNFEKLLVINNIVYKRNYKSEVYPFKCDFYLSDFDIYIELNIHFSHGKEPFNKDNQNHLDIVKECERKSQEVNYKGKKKVKYLKAINTWIIDDVNKRQTAINNKLNYIEIFDKNKLEDLVMFIKNDYKSGYYLFK